MPGDIISKQAGLANSIPSMQETNGLIRLLRARFRTNREGKLIQGLLLSVTILLPIASLAAVHYSPTVATKASFTLITVFLMLLDTALLDRYQKDLLKRGAKLQEEFDVKVFGLKWNGFIAGAKVDPEDVLKAGGTSLSQAREDKLKGWYARCVGSVPLAVGRLICQRTNIVYDSRLRKRYGSTLLCGAIALSLVLFGIGVAQDMKLPDLLLTILIPVQPLLTWAVKEHRRQLDTVGALTTLRAEVDKLWRKAMSGASVAELEVGSRELQNALYQHRATSALVFDWVYDLLRSANEQEANHAAEQLVEEAKTMLTQKEQQ